MESNEITITVSFEATVAHTNRVDQRLGSKYYNGFVNMIVRDSRWPINVSFVGIGPKMGRLVCKNWAEVDFSEMIETLVSNDYTFTIMDVNTYMVTRTVLDTAAIRKSSATMTSHETERTSAQGSGRSVTRRESRKTVAGTRARAPFNRRSSQKAVEQKGLV